MDEKRRKKKDRLSLSLERCYSIIIRPLTTEKLTLLEASRRYGFLVDRGATKFEIKESIEHVFGVTVTSVNSLVVKRVKSSRSKGKQKRHQHVGGSRLVTMKKAYVTLAHDQVFRELERFES